MRKNIIILCIIVVCLVLIDQITKIIINNQLTLGDEIILINNFFSIHYVHNTGAAWSLFAGQQIILIIGTFLALIFFCYLAKDLSFSKKKLYSISLSMMFSGAIGNLIDRIFFGYVRDYIDFLIFGYDFPIFNVADMCLTIGVFLFAIDIIFFQNKKGENNENNPSQSNNS